MKHIAYLQPSPVPPPKDPQLDRFFLLSGQLSGDVLQPVWFRDPQQIEAMFGPGSYPVYQRGSFRYHWFLTGRYQGPAGRLRVFWFYIETLLRLHKQRRFDCIMAYSHLTTGLIGLLLKWLSGARLIIEIATSPHLVYITEKPVITWKDRLRKLYSDLCLHLTVDGADCTHKLYPEQLDHYPRLKHCPSTVFHEFVPTSTIERQPPAEESYLFLVGAPWYLKGADLLVKAYTDIAPEFPGLKLKIQGHYPDLAQYTPPGGFGPGIEILKAVPNALTITRIGQARIFILPSRCEGMGRVLIEAMAAGVPLIGSNLGGIPSMVRDGVNGLLFEPGNVESLKQALRRLLSDPDLCRRMGEEGYRIAHQELDERAYVRGFIAAVEKATA